MKDTSKNQDIHISSVYSDNENLVDLLENQHGLTLLETDINDILHAVKQDRIKTNTAMKDLTKYFIDLSKCSEDQQKHIFSLLPPEKVEGDYSIKTDFKYLHFEDAIDAWFVDEEYFYKQELTYPEFIKLFKGGEGDPYAELLKNADILLNMFTELDSEQYTKWEQHQIDAVQFISDKINSK